MFYSITNNSIQFTYNLYVQIYSYSTLQINASFSCHNVSVDLGQGQDLLVLNSWLVLEIH